LNIAVNSPERLSGAVNVTILGNDVLNELNSIIIGIQAWSDVEHNEDGSHKDITADSLTATGNVVADGDGEFGGDVTVGESLTVAGDTSLQATSIGRAIYITGVDDEIIGADDVLYNAGSLADVGVVRISSHANQVCGIKVGTSAATDYRAFWLFNDSATALTLEHESAVPASATYRLWLPASRSLTLRQYEGVLVWRDTANSRWRVVAGHHEQGTWTPVLQFGGLTTGINGTLTGTYTRTGNVVVAECRIMLTSKGSATGDATVTGLPYTSAAYGAPQIIDGTGNMTGLTGTMLASVSDVSTLVNILQTSATGRGTVTDAEFTNTSELRFGVIYRI
jgi:hypothetical protein